MSDNEEYDLGKSKKALGPLYPILKDAHGNIIDGFHRQNSDPDWQSITVGTIDDSVKLELARLAIHSCRRTIPKTETDNRVAFLVKNGLKPEEIADKSGISLSTVYRHMPQDLKDQTKVEAKLGKVSDVTRQETVKIQDMPKCDSCPVHTSDLKPFPSEQEPKYHLCHNCTIIALEDPHRFKMHLNGVAPVKLPFPKKKVPDEELSNLITCGQCGRPVGIMNAKNVEGLDLCPGCYDKAIHSKTERQERMHPGVSKFEDKVRLGYKEHGIPLGLQNEFITLPFRFGDDVWYLPKGVLVTRLNGEEAHKNRDVKDDKIVEALETLGVRVLSYTYKNGTDTERDEVLGLIEAKLKELRA